MHGSIMFPISGRTHWVLFIHLPYKLPLKQIHCQATRLYSTETFWTSTWTLIDQVAACLLCRYYMICKLFLPQCMRIWLPYMAKSTSNRAASRIKNKQNKIEVVKREPPLLGHNDTKLLEIISRLQIMFSNVEIRLSEQKLVSLTPFSIF